MSKNRVLFSGLVLILLLVIGWISYCMLHVGETEETYQISVIVENSNSDRWISLRQGLKQAANDNQVDLNFVSTRDFSSLQEQLELIEQEIEKGAQGVIVQMVSSDVFSDGLQEIPTNVAVMLLETDIILEDIYAYTGPDNVEIGRALAKTIKDDYGVSLQGKKIGILSGNQKQLAMQKRLQGLEEVLLEENVKITWKVNSITETKDEELRHWGESNRADIIIALGNDETEELVDFLQSDNNRNYKCSLYGVGGSEKSVYYLDKGIINSLVVPNEYAMGYQSLEAMAKQIRFHAPKAESSIVDYRVVNRQNLYDEENQKVLFPIVQ